MRVLFLTDRLSDRGGADLHLAQVIAWSVDEGHRVTVAYGRDDRSHRLCAGAEPVRIRGLAAAVRSSSRLASLEALLKGCDVVHVQNVMNPEALAMAVGTGRAVVTIQDHRVFCPGPGKTLPDATRCMRAMTDVACETCLPNRGYRRRMLDLTHDRLQAIRSATVVTLSRYMADELEAVGVADVEVVPPWVDGGDRRTHAGTTFVLGGRLVEHKGALDGWLSWRSAGRPLPLVVAGAGPLENRLDGADHLGWLDARSLRRELRSARALIFPARWQEPFGILGIEALAEGTPVIVADSGGTRSWSEHGCLRVPRGNVEEMSRAILRLADDPVLALELGRAGQEAVRRRFSRSTLEPKLHDLYARTAGS